MNNISHAFSKVSAVVFVFILLLAPNSWARLGETFEQIQSRYGVLMKVDNVTRADYPQYFFQKDGIDIRVRFVNGKSAQEIFSAPVPNIQTVAAEILSSNAQGSTWSSTAIGKSTEYMRADGKATAQYIRSKRSPDRIALLRVQTIEFNRAFNPRGVEF